MPKIKPPCSTGPAPHKYQFQLKKAILARRGDRFHREISRWEADILFKGKMIECFNSMILLKYEKQFCWIDGLEARDN